MTNSCWKLMAVLSLFFFACQAELPPISAPTSSLEYVQASSRFHDPEARWMAFAAEVDVASRFAGARSGWVNHVLLDRAKDTFRRSQLKDGYLLTQTISPSGACEATWPNPGASDSDLERNGLGNDPCRYIEFRKDFFDFLFGLPMVALEGDADFIDPPTDTVLFGHSVKQLEVRFTERENQPTWWLYIDPNTFRLIGSRFIQENGGGEYLYYPCDVTFDGFLIKAVQQWFRLDGSEISVDSLFYKTISQ